MHRTRIKHLAIVASLLALPPLTCAVAPALQGLLLRTERLEAILAQLPSVVVDGEDRVVGPVLDLGYFASQYPMVSAQIQFATVEVHLDGQPPFIAGVGTRWIGIPLRESLKFYYESEDCSGTPWVETLYTWSHATRYERGLLWSIGLVTRDRLYGTNKDLYLVDPADPLENVNARSTVTLHAYEWFPYGSDSFRSYTDDCRTLASLPPYNPVKTIRARTPRLVGDLSELFTPPFRLVSPDAL